MYDCFIFNNEVDMIKLRILEGLPYVNKFIIIESYYTHKNIKKDKLYSTYINDFLDKYKDKIIHHIIPCFPSNINEYDSNIIQTVNIRKHINDTEYNAWLKEHYQREQIYYVLLSLNILPDDLCIISDLDEIPNYKQIINNYNNNRINNVITKYKTNTYLHNIHYKQFNYIIYAPITSPFKLLKKNNISNIRFFNINCNIIDDNSFIHLTSFLNPLDLLIKYSSISESVRNENINITLDSIHYNTIKEYLYYLILPLFDTNLTLYVNDIMPGNISILPKFFICDNIEIKLLKDKIDNSHNINDVKIILKEYFNI